MEIIIDYILMPVDKYHGCKSNRIFCQAKMSQATDLKKLVAVFYLFFEGDELMSNEKLEKIAKEEYVLEKKLTAAQHREKRLRNELKLLTRNERTHRLCTRAGMLETFLREPTLLTDDDVMELLTFIFSKESVQNKLNAMIKMRQEEWAAEAAENT